MDPLRQLTLRWFVPDELQTDRESCRGALRTVVFGLAMLFWAPVFIPIYLWLGSPRSAFLILLAAIAVILSMLSLRWTKSVSLTGNSIAGAVFAVFIALASVSGGIEAASIWWLASVPIIGLVLCGIRSGIAWAIAGCVACVVFLGLAVSGFAVPDDLGAEGHRLLNCAAACGIILCATTLTLTFKVSESAARSDLEAARRASEQASRAKSDFLANMSHEIRTPMNAILGMTELVLDTPLSGEQREYLNAVSESGESLLEILNEILDFSKIESGKLALEPRAFDLRENLGDTLKSLGIRAHKKELELVCRVRPDVPPQIVGDAARLRQIVINLVGNAIKFTETGEVVVEVDCPSRDARRAILHFTVSDTGVGIPCDKRKSIFEAFEQADNSTTRRFGGTGLGLAICSRLTKLMDGWIWVESEEGKGSTFHFTGDFGVADEKPVESCSLDPARLRGVRVLIVEDNAANRECLEEILAGWDMIPESAGGAREAMAMICRAHAEGTPYDVVLADSRMPRADGFSLAEQLRQDPDLDASIVMMLTSNEQSGVIDRCESLGIADYVLKPVKSSELFEAFAGTLRPVTRSKERPGQSVSGRVARFGPIKVLLAEDSRVNQQLVVGLLEKHGSSVKVAGNGREALAAFESEPFDLVLMDIQMPEMDGVEATAEIRLREQATGKHIPIIALTAHAMKEDRKRCLDAGMDEYVTKPVRSEQLFDTIALVLGEIRRPESEAETSDPADTATVDWEEAIRRVNGDHRILHTLIEAVLEEAPSILEAVHRAVRDRDEGNLKVAAHTLKGAIRYFGVEKVFDQAFELERRGRDGRLDGVEEIASALTENMRRLIRELTEYVEEKQPG